MHRLTYPGIKLPEVYVCKDKADTIVCRDAGIPYIVWRGSDDRLIMTVLYHWLSKRFPKINWCRQLGINRVESFAVYVPDNERPNDSGSGSYEDTDLDGEETYDTEDVELERGTSTVTEDYREFTGTEGERVVRRVSSDDFFADAGARVNVEQLQALGLLPQFMSDIADAISLNLTSSIMWRECYNKRLNECVGDFQVSGVAPNLIILDISGSIPEGISKTMLQLVDTLRSQASADLIVTGGSSYYWPADSELPSPEWIRDNVSRSNESDMFLDILENRLSGRHFGNVISFGDNDSPYYEGSYFWHSMPGDVYERKIDAAGYTIQVDRVMHYHTFMNDRETGYARWVARANPNVEQVFDTSWCDMMIR